jgi:YesN/AraC family two-component response regulator
MKIYIQNMVSLRCKMMVKSVLDKLGIAYNSVELGEVQLLEPLTELLKHSLKGELHKSGLELIFDKKAILIEKIINIIVEMVHYSDEFPNVNFSTFLSEKMEQDYHKMAELFSKTKGMTIEHFIILHKVEKVKELIMYDELNLTEISYRLNYNSVAHLSKQFKQATGLTPTFFKSISKLRRINLEDL